MVMLEPKSYLILNHKLKMTEGVGEASAEKPLYVSMRNFVAIEWKLTKGIVLEYAVKSPLVISNVGAS